MQQKLIVIILACYNGEKYLEQQIESIVNQRYSNWQLFIRDDASNDNSIKIIERYCQKDSRIKNVKDQLGNLRQCLNFNELIRHCLEITDSDIFVFADQDDIWFSDKLERMAEKFAQQDMPKLIFSNYYDYYDKSKEKKLVYNKAFNYTPDEFCARLLMQNWIMGCTMMLNRALLKLSYPIIIEADNHDNWIAIIASLCGEIDYINQPMILHRIHLDNVTTNANTTNFLNRVKRFFQRIKTSDEVIAKKLVICNEILLRLEHAKIQYKLDLLLEYQKLLMSYGANAKIVMRNNKFSMVNKLQNAIFLKQLKNSNKRAKAQKNNFS